LSPAACLQPARRNPKHEIRNPKETQNQNPEIQNSRAEDFEFGYLDLGFLSEFGFRVSDFPRGGCDGFDTHRLHSPRAAEEAVISPAAPA
jgi:hypothetical protein